MASSIHAIITDPRYHGLLAIVKGFRNGVVYGAKIRFPHALVMSLLFGRGDWKTRGRQIFQATKMHALNLGSFVALYKTLLLMQRTANKGKKRGIDTFVAGLISAYVVFGDRTAVNEQMALYVCSRVIASFIPRAGGPLKSTSSPASTSSTSSPVTPIPPDARYFSIFTAITWAAVMWIFDHRGQTLQPGMFNSMIYIYRDSEKWTNLRTLLWHNT